MVCTTYIGLIQYREKSIKNWKNYDPNQWGICYAGAGFGSGVQAFDLPNIVTLYSIAYGVTAFYMKTNQMPRLADRNKYQHDTDLTG